MDVSSKKGGGATKSQLVAFILANPSKLSKAQKATICNVRDDTLSKSKLNALNKETLSSYASRAGFGRRTVAKRGGDGRTALWQQLKNDDSFSSKDAFAYIFSYYIYYCTNPYAELYIADDNYKSINVYARELINGRFIQVEKKYHKWNVFNGREQMDTTDVFNEIIEIDEFKFTPSDDTDTKIAKLTKAIITNLNSIFSNTKAVQNLLNDQIYLEQNKYSMEELDRLKKTQDVAREQYVRQRLRSEQPIDRETQRIIDENNRALQQSSANQATRTPGLEDNRRYFGVATNPNLGGGSKRR